MVIRWDAVHSDWHHTSMDEEHKLYDTSPPGLMSNVVLSWNFAFVECIPKRVGSSFDGLWLASISSHSHSDSVSVFLF